MNASVIDSLFCVLSLGVLDPLVRSLHRKASLIVAFACWVMRGRNRAAINVWWNCLFGKLQRKLLVELSINRENCCEKARDQDDRMGKVQKKRWESVPDGDEVERRGEDGKSCWKKRAEQGSGGPVLFEGCVRLLQCFFAHFFERESHVLNDVYL